MKIHFRNPKYLLGKLSFSIMLLLMGLGSLVAQQKKPAFKVLAFYTGKNDLAHISFVNEAKEWFPQQAAKEGFSFEATNDWTRLNTKSLKKVDVVLFLDTRPEDPEQRKAFERYMEHGGAWMGFHFSAFALTPSAYNQDWDWYHNTFLGSGQYKSNTWRPTKATLKVEDSSHPVVQGLGSTMTASPNEWYRWEKDLTQNPDIKILLSIDPVSFPLGTGPKQSEIWHSGYYPVVWTNTHYKMLYVNMGHNDMDYEGGTNATLSHTFDNPEQNRMVLNALWWLAGKSRP